MGIECICVYVYTYIYIYVYLCIHIYIQIYNPATPTDPYTRYSGALPMCKHIYCEYVLLFAFHNLYKYIYVYVYIYIYIRSAEADSEVGGGGSSPEEFSCTHSELIRTQ